jgi:hypothetical protein
MQKNVAIINTSKVDIAGVLLREDASRSLRYSAYKSKKLKDYGTRYRAYDRKALFDVLDMSREWSRTMLGCTFSVVTDYRNLTRMLQQ